MYDVIIVGLGPSGYAASIYAARAGLKTLVLEAKMPGGLLNYTNIVNNYPGFINISGPDLSFKMYEHFKTFDIDYKNEEVKEIEVLENEHIVKTQSNVYKCKKIIIATGRSRRKLGLDHEEEFMGKGISYCALCDGNLYKNKSIIVVGAGDSSLEETLYLSKIVKDITLIVRGQKLTGKQDLIDEINKLNNINIKYNTVIDELLIKDNKINGAKLSNGEKVEAEGIFVYIGFDPIIPFNINKKIETVNGYIKVNSVNMTNINGIYAAGDIVNKNIYQIISAEYDGINATIDIINKLKMESK